MAPERRRVLVTGAGSGIGRELALCAARDGAGVDLVGRRADALAATLHLLPGDGHRVVAADVATAGGRADVAAAVAHAGGRLAVLANNAGRVASGLLADTTDRTIEEVLATNVAAPLALTRSLLPALAGGGRVLFVGSVFGDIGHPYFAAYSASKHAVRGMADALRRELRADGIGVTYAAPRATRTGATADYAALISPLGMTLDPADRVAQSIWRALRRGASTVPAPGAERLFVLLQRLAPGVVDLALTRVRGRVERIAARHAGGT